ncbi:Alpha/beta hydrolase fold-containing protein [Desulfonema limicola]|uniref:Alpha/beta hydrolase fold-containing protein n=1 Tax=Desulfonema limicola TaxID=45656 RepID=A0A975B2Z9_9BACT|nr:alpha/beta fold hydrolase [Desulfonema limicola]QTA77838.1 Alpha/beta hydrolase fold-containing protein [Desulfonema limicola]
MTHRQKSFILMIIFGLLFVKSIFAADRQYIEQNPDNRSIAIFIHGFTGNYEKTWGRLPLLLLNDQNLIKYDFLFWGYPTKFFGKNETIDNIADHLKTEIDFLNKPFDQIILVGHSMGGLVIRAYIVQALLDGKGDDLNNIKDILLFGTPNDGILKAQFVPKIVNDQIVDMGIASEFIIKLRRYWIQRVIDVNKNDKYNRSIPTIAIAGFGDHFVSKESVESIFRDTAVTDGDHVSMVKPNDPNHLTFRIIRKRLQAALQINDSPNRTIESDDKKLFFKGKEFNINNSCIPKFANNTGISGDSIVVETGNHTGCYVGFTIPDYYKGTNAKIKFDISIRKGSAYVLIDDAFNKKPIKATTKYMQNSDIYSIEKEWGIPHYRDIVAAVAVEKNSIVEIISGSIMKVDQKTLKK